MKGPKKSQPPLEGKIFIFHPFNWAALWVSPPKNNYIPQHLQNGYINSYYLDSPKVVCDNSLRILAYLLCGEYSTIWGMSSHEISTLHCKKRIAVFPSPDGMSPKSSWAGIIKLIKLFPAKECSASDIPAGDGKTPNLFTVIPPPPRAPAFKSPNVGRIINY